jgi:hypothetical protein
VDLIGRFGEAGVRRVNTLLFSADLQTDIELISSEVLPRCGGEAGCGEGPAALSATVCARASPTRSGGSRIPVPRTPS